MAGRQFLSPLMECVRDRFRQPQLSRRNGTNSLLVGEMGVGEVAPIRPVDGRLPDPVDGRLPDLTWFTSSLMTVALLSERRAVVILRPRSANTMTVYCLSELVYQRIF